MATKKHVQMLCEGADAWNKWRISNGVQVPDLEGADLSVDSVGLLALESVNLAGAILRRASLSQQRLVRADFQNANMRSANLRSVDLEGANLRNANLQEAQLQPALVPFEEDLSRDPPGAMSVLASEIKSEGGSFTIESEGEGGSNILPPHFIVRGQRMGRGSSLKMATLDGANLARANLARSNFAKASLRNADLNGAILDEAVLAQADLVGAKLRAVKLTELNLAASDLRAIPIEITQLFALRVLDLNKNRIVTLPPELGALSNLETLDLRHNSLRELPKELQQLSKLRHLYLQGNADLGIPPEILGAEPTWIFSYETSNEPAAILDYYFRTLAGRRPLNEAKLILVGFGGVGKTSLVSRLLHNTFNPHEKLTEGISINEWRITLRGDEHVKLNVWDFGGQEIMHATHQFFLTERSVYLLVLNGRQGREEADAEYWLRLIESFGKNSPILVVLNKIKEHHFDVNQRALQQKFPSIRGFFQTDCEDGTGLTDLTRAIERESDGLEHLRAAFPTSWFKIKEHLSQSRNNYLTLAEYRAICEAHGEVSKEAQASLALHLHALGVALNYQNDPRLNDMNVLNPHWVTNGIYAILNSETLAKQNGVISLNQVAEILDHDIYPGSTHAFLCQLMKKFELCFDLNEDDLRYLIPELLDKQEPAESATFIESECLNFEYEYAILPEGVIARLIVRTHVLSNEQLRWRTGVILNFEGNRALIKADIQDKRVLIRVAGANEGRRRLLAIIRSDFERIHKSFTFEVRELVPIPEHPGIRVGYRELLVMEQSGYKTYPLVSGSRILEVNVKDLLSGVEVSRGRHSTGSLGKRERRTRLFYSYSHKDERLRDELETHLKLLQREGLIEAWHDRQISGGQEWEGEISSSLEEADIILLLVSSDFIASDYAYGIEMKRALERHELGDARVIPVIVRDVDWHKTPFSKLQALPKNGKPVFKWSSRDTGWRDVSLGIRRVVEELAAKKGLDLVG